MVVRAFWSARRLARHRWHDPPHIRCVLRVDVSVTRVFLRSPQQRRGKGRCLRAMLKLYARRWWWNRWMRVNTILLVRPRTRISGFVTACSAWVVFVVFIVVGVCFFCFRPLFPLSCDLCSFTWRARAVERRQQRVFTGTWLLLLSFYATPWLGWLPRCRAGRRQTSFFVQGWRKKSPHTPQVLNVYRDKEGTWMDVTMVGRWPGQNKILYGLYVTGGKRGPKRGGCGGAGGLFGGLNAAGFGQRGEESRRGHASL